jgi:hypothetical protein
LLFPAPITDNVPIELFTKILLCEIILFNELIPPLTIKLPVDVLVVVASLVFKIITELVGIKDPELIKVDVPNNRFPKLVSDVI